MDTFSTLAMVVLGAVFASAAFYTVNTFLDARIESKRLREEENEQQIFARTIVAVDYVQGSMMTDWDVDLAWDHYCKMKAFALAEEARYAST